MYTRASVALFFRIIAATPLQLALIIFPRGATLFISLLIFFKAVFDVRLTIFPGYGFPVFG